MLQSPVNTSGMADLQQVTEKFHIVYATDNLLVQTDDALTSGGC